MGIDLTPINGTVEKMKFCSGIKRTEQHEKSRWWGSALRNSAARIRMLTAATLNCGMRVR
jgi:hypothetical protein